MYLNTDVTLLVNVFDPYAQVQQVDYYWSEYPTLDPDYLQPLAVAEQPPFSATVTVAWPFPGNPDPADLTNAFYLLAVALDSNGHEFATVEPYPTPIPDLIG